MIPTNAVALLYRSHLRPNATTIMEHVEAFSRHSSFGIVPINSDAPYSPWLEEHQFQAVVVHYSFFDWQDPRYFQWLGKQRSAYKVAFIQDEYDYCQARFSFLNRFNFDCVFSLLEPDWHDEVYGRHTSVDRVEWTLPGYVSEEMIEAAAVYGKPDEERSIDIGYRARTLPFFMGRGAQEKHIIAEEVERRAKDSGLVLDVDRTEGGRLYGTAWHEFLGDCKGVLGVEAGTSTFDLDGSLRDRCETYLRKKPKATFEEVSSSILAPHEDNIYYRTVSPRHFEAAAFGCVQILFEGRYSGVLQPGDHYLSLKKDFSNFDDVIDQFRDPQRRAEIRTRAEADLIASGRFSYREFVRTHFDRVLLEESLQPHVPSDELTGLRQQVKILDETRQFQRPKRNLLLELYNAPFPGRHRLVRILKALGVRRGGSQVSLFTVDDDYWDRLERNQSK